MNEKEMLEEMAKYCCNPCEMSWSCDEGYCSEKGQNGYKKCGIAIETAEKLYNIGYRKIPKGSVVLSKEEYEKYQNLKRDVEHSFEYNQGYTDGQNNARKEERSLRDYECQNIGYEVGKIEARKETAKEILKFALNMSYFGLDDVLIFPINSLINYITKQYGVEE